MEDKKVENEFTESGKLLINRNFIKQKLGDKYESSTKQFRPLIEQFVTVKKVGILEAAGQIIKLETFIESPFLQLVVLATATDMIIEKDEESKKTNNP